jgi:hypothetical protein
MPITNEQGQVALRYYQDTGPILVQGTPSGTEYTFICHVVSMAWVEPEDVDHLLARRKTCCGGSKRQIFDYAHPNAIAAWRNGGRP